MDIAQNAYWDFCHENASEQFQDYCCRYVQDSLYLLLGPVALRGGSIARGSCTVASLLGCCRLAHTLLTLLIARVGASLRQTEKLVTGSSPPVFALEEELDICLCQCKVDAAEFTCGCCC